MKYTPPNQSATAGARAGSAVPLTVIIEIQARSYITLMCGCLTSRETQDQYTAFRPRGTVKYFCEHCGTWETKKTVAERLELPDNPMF